MCGIAGANFNQEGVRAACDLIAYRGPDAQGFTANDGVFLGHRRLSIIDTDARANQPFSTPDGSVTIIYNGEVYNYKELRHELEDSFEFRTTSDTEVIVAAYLKYGDACVSRLQGMFAFAIHDRAKKRLLLARDPQGIKPLYYSFANGALAFASELKSVVEISKGHGTPSVVDGRSLRLYAAFGYVPSPMTLIAGISKLEKSHTLSFDLVSCEMPTVTAFAPAGLRDVSSLDTFVDLMEEKILAHLASDVPVGLFFSGGTDSSLIAAVLAKHGIHLTTFSLRTAKGAADIPYFDAINAQLGLQCETHDYGAAEFASSYALVQSRIDEPLSDSSLFPTTYIALQAAHKVKVVLSGEGGDEFFYGYHRQLALARMARREPSKKAILLLSSLPSRSKTLPRAAKALGMPYLYYLAEMSPAKQVLGADVFFEAASYLWSMNAHPIDIDKDIALENDLLHKIDAATSYASIEGRVPLLDSEITRNSSQPFFDHLHGGVLKAGLKEILCRYLPCDLVYRPKTGFGLDASHLGSPQARHDVEQGIVMAKNFGFIDLSRVTVEGTITRDPHFGFALASLYRACGNLGLRP
ncbi:MAG: asparagine synthase (glutamine-hydrolyzing) [Patescibacteria group bacterium]